MTDEQLLELLPRWYRDGKSEFYQIRCINRRITLGQVNDDGTLWAYGMIVPHATGNRDGKAVVEQGCVNVKVTYAALLVAVSRGRFPGVTSTLRKANLPEWHTNTSLLSTLVIGQQGIASYDPNEYRWQILDESGTDEIDSLDALAVKALEHPAVIRMILEANGMEGDNWNGQKAKAQQQARV